MFPVKKKERLQYQISSEKDKDYQTIHVNSENGKRNLSQQFVAINLPSIVELLCIYWSAKKRMHLTYIV